jgi:hypothetical protein
VDTHDDAAQADQVLLRAALNRYALARRACRRRAAGAEAELAASRLALVHLLQDAGWEPPPALRASLAEDARGPVAQDRRSA